MFDIYDVELVLKVPNNQGKLLDFRTRILDIIYAVEEFNYSNFSIKKKLYLKNVERKVIQLYLYIDKKSDVTARDISAFSKRLYHDKNWSIFTRETSKLFTTLKLERINLNINSKYSNVRLKFDDENFISKDVLKIKEKYSNIDNSNIDIFNNHELSDDDLMYWIKKIIQTQNQGGPMEVERKKKIIYELKEIIKNNK